MQKTEAVLTEIELMSETTSLPIVGRKKGRLLESVVRKKQPANILEIGTLIGYSSILMAKHLKKGKITTIELSRKAAEIARKNIEIAGLGKKIKVKVGDALDIIPKLKGKFQLIFIDASKNEYIAYLLLLEKNRNIGKGTIIVADNAKIFAEEMASYLNYVRKSGSYKSFLYDFGEDGMEVSNKI